LLVSPKEELVQAVVEDPLVSLILVVLVVEAVATGKSSLKM